MIKVKIIFVVLIYRNIKDMLEYIQNIESLGIDAKVIMVNSYYDDASMNDCSELAKKYDCDFLNVENKGYGYGNNIGIKHAIRSYEYEFLIVSNPDIIIKVFDEKALDNFSKAVVGPTIRTLNNRSQNPYWATSNYLGEWLIYIGYKKDIKSFILIGKAVNRIIRELFLLLFNKSKKKNHRVYAIHGCFVVYSKEAIDAIGSPYDEAIFLYSEEACIADILKNNSINTYITKSIKVIHKEDGSTKFTKHTRKSIEPKSFMVYYEKYRLHKE